MLEPALVMLLSPAHGLHMLEVSGRHSSANGVETGWERIGLKEKKPSCGAKQAPQQPEREGASSASDLEMLQVIKPGFWKKHFSFRSSLQRFWLVGNGDLQSATPGILGRSTQGWGLEVLGCFLCFGDHCKRHICAQAFSTTNRGTNVQGCCSLLLP